MHTASPPNIRKISQHPSSLQFLQKDFSGPINLGNPNEFTVLVFSLQVTDDLGATSVGYITITVGEAGEVTISDIINNCSFESGETIACDGQYDLSESSASQCPLYGQSFDTCLDTVLDHQDQNKLL